MRFGAGVLGFALCLVPSGCGSECRPTPCGAVDRGPEPGDYVVELDTDSGFVFLEIEGHESDFALVAGEFVFTTDDPECSATPTTPCTIVLERLRVEISPFTQPTSEGDLRVESPVISVSAPIEVVDSGSGYFLNPGVTGAQTCATVNGTRDSAAVALGDNIILTLDIPRDVFSLDGSFPVRFRAGSDGCEKLDATARVLAYGRTPWAQRP